MSLGRLFLLFVLVPLADLTLLVWAGGHIGFLPTVALVVLTAAVGSWLARREGTAAWRRVQTRLTTGGLPGPELLDGLIILIAGVLLLTPGFLTDLTGLLGLLPPTRAVMRTALASRLKQSVQSGSIRFASFAPMGPVGPGFSPEPEFRPPSPPPASEPASEDSEVQDATIIEETSRPLRSRS
ncbi:MAG: FxsA family protein [Bacteroidota bacterium]